MSFFYSLLATLLYFVALPYLMYLRFKPKYKDSIPARFFLKNNPSFTDGGIWFHACSFGEVRSLSPFIDKISPLDVRISVITQTGFKEASKHSQAEVRYLPFEIFLPFWIRKQKVLIVMEAELWPLLFIVAKAKGIKTVLLNARISDNSYASYLRFGWLYHWIFSHVDLIFAQSIEDEQRLKTLGAKSVQVSGNIKAFSEYSVTHVYPKMDTRRVIVLASTHEGEEELILSHLALQTNDQLIVGPRHPERFEKVDKLLKTYALNENKAYARLSEHDVFGSDIILCDKMGELINLYAIADVVILGGSFVDGIGGHNPLEPAFFGTKIISGEFIFNQKVLFDAVDNAFTCKVEDLKNVFDSIDTYPKSTIVHRGDFEPLLEQILGNKNGKSL
ncbi:lipid IV(A) 3-deoxy-D-manno-octulosonic acid transferase [Sulfurospirillum oryzae]|uniref:lipid IV(A) 3-deoxy-D-manno-octulosonic acid transferase n=1 Tax=Sulfurospirillum oryzae TaxID=2976535 RepID=UPI0021E9039A|nr:lipid IV(A) 3-deoxy-D-manno-octulosonic acid transferase [Sulfurospirillum oryzae]